MPTTGRNAGPPAPNPQTTAALARVAAAAYADERDRLKALDTKAGLLLSATSAVIGLVLTITVRPPDPILHQPRPPAALSHLPVALATPAGWCWTHAAALYFVPLLAGLTCLLLAEWYFVQAVRMSEVAGLNVDYWVDRGTLARATTAVQAELGAAYLRTVQDNQAVGAAKAARLERASRVLLLGMLAVTALPALVAVLVSVLQ